MSSAYEEGLNSMEIMFIAFGASTVAFLVVVVIYRYKQYLEKQRK